jgi:diguanylate cyclase (GGDEF)-like protein
MPNDAPAASDLSPANSGNRLVYLAEDDPELCRLLALQLGHFGYQVRTFPSTESVCEALRDCLPAAVIMDISFPGGERAGTEAMLSLRRQGVVLPPLLFLSSRRDFNARLDAVRAGGEAYFTKPVEIGDLVDRLDVLTVSTKPEPYRVMIVEDTSLLAAVYAYILEQAGMMTCQVTNPMEVMDRLADFSPELILMDMYMPGASGEEVAKVLRQQESLVGVPIVFLSGETDLGRQLAAIGHGADDFLVKPIRPEHLLLSVTSRIERYRVLRSFMVRDSLTGLLNHTKIKEQLEVEIERAKRQQRPLSFAMIDLDHFKRVNDTYGHPTGDKVLKGLARLLLQRLRKVDVIGRYGGEEFAVILTDTPATDAVRVLDDIRKDLAQIRQQSEDGEFSVTFSCGVAAYPDFATAEAISNAADKALYRAKHGGRNRTVLAAIQNPHKVR